jgi:uncharacterized coiled-coil DUF342 family protein
MKSSLAFVLIALQAVTAGVVVALLVGRNDSTSAIEAKFEEWNAKVQGSVNQMRQIVNSQERLRQEYQGHSPGGGGPPISTGPGPGATQGDPPPAGDPAPTAPPAKAFPEATAALAKLKDLERQYRDEVKNSNPQVNSLKAERTKISADLGEVLKPVTEASNKTSAYISDHMVDLTPTQIDGLKKKAADWNAQIVQINVPEANLVDRCESCHMNAREPIRVSAAVMTLKGEKKPDEYARAFASHPDPELLKTHDPDKFGCSPCHQGNGRATTSMEKAHGDYEHWLWPLFPKQNAEAGCQTCHAADMHLSVGDVGAHISNGKFLFRQRGCMGCHRYEGFDKEPEDLISIAQQMKLFDQQKIDNSKIAADLMKQADAASSNDEANRLNQEAVALRVSNSKIDGRIQQLDFQTHSLMQDIKKIGPNLKDVRLKLNRDWIPVWLKKPTDFRPTTKMPNFRLTDHQIQTISAYNGKSGAFGLRVVPPSAPTTTSRESGAGFVEQRLLA